MRGDGDEEPVDGETADSETGLHGRVQGAMEEGGSRCALPEYCNICVKPFLQDGKHMEAQCDRNATV